MCRVSARVCVCVRERERERETRWVDNESTAPLRETDLERAVGKLLFIGSVGVAEF